MFILAFGFLIQTLSSSDWEVGVQKCYDRCEKLFNRYPNNIYDIGENLIESFKSYIDSSKIWNSSNSTIVSTRSTDLLDTIALLSDLGISPSYSLSVHRRATPNLFKAYREIVSSLSEYIDQLIHPINDVLTELEQSFDDLFKQFSRFCLLGIIGDCRELDFKRIMNSAQYLANVISLIADTALNHPSCETIANDTYEAIAILVCILFDNFLNIQGAIITKAASQSHDITDFHFSCLMALDPLIRGVAGSMNSMTADIAKGVRDVQESLLNHIGDFNYALNTLIGVVEGVTITVEQVIENLLNSSERDAYFN